MCDAALRVQLAVGVTLDAGHGFVSQQLHVEGTAPVAEADEQLHHLQHNERHQKQDPHTQAVMLRRPIF